MNTSPPPSELVLPKVPPWIIGGAFFWMFIILGYTFVSGIMLIGVLMHPPLDRGIVAAIIAWAICAFLWYTFAEDHSSFRGFLVGCLGNFAQGWFVDVTSPEGQLAEIRHGFRLFGRRFIKQRIALDKVKFVDWSMGQASAKSGRDLDDWHISLWFDHDDLTRSTKGRKKGYSHPDQELLTMNLNSNKEYAEKFALTLVGLLRNAGLPLTRVEGEARFVRKGPQDETSKQAAYAE
jgi:hypothetical protein